MSEVKESRTIEQSVIVAHICDNCGVKESDQSKYDDRWLHFDEYPGGWGNDSHESMHYYDVCSAKCFIEIMPARIKENEPYPDAEVADMPVGFAKELLILLTEKQS